MYKIIRNTDLIKEICKHYNYHDYKNICQLTEIYGYECNENFTQLKGIFEYKNEIPNLILIINKIINQKLNLNNKNILIEYSEKIFKKIFNYLNNIYINQQDYESLKIEILKNNQIYINEYIYQAIQIKDQFTIFEEIKDEIEEYNILVNQNHTNIQYDNHNQDYQNINFIRQTLTKLNINEIMTHHMLENSINQHNKLSQKFLSKHYIRFNLTESFKSEFDIFSNKNQIFEIAEVYNLNNRTNHTNLLISFCKKNIMLKSQIDQILKLIFNNKIIIDYPKNTCHYVNNNQIHYIGTIESYNNWFILEIINITNILNNKDKIINNVNNIIHINIYSENIYDDILNIYLQDNKIINIHIIDKYKDKYTLELHSYDNADIIINNLNLNKKINKKITR